MSNLEDIEIRLSYSTISNYLLVCERKFELLRLRNPLLMEDRGQNIHTMLGSIGHKGIQRLLQGQQLEEVWIRALQEWDFALWDERNVKTYSKLSACLEVFRNQWDWEKYEAVPIKGKKPDELSFRINFGPKKHYFLGFMDNVLHNKQEDIYSVMEIKFTGNNKLDLEPFYRNSEQGLGNSVGLHSIVPEHKSYEIIYVVFQFKGVSGVPLMHVFNFRKSLKDRLEWLQTLGIRYNRILDGLGKYGLFPKNENSCGNQYGRVCPLYGQCDLIPQVWSPEKGKEGEVDFELEIDELIEEQVKGLD